MCWYLAIRYACQDLKVWTLCIPGSRQQSATWFSRWLHWTLKLYFYHFSGYYSLNGTTNTIYSTFAMACCWIIPEYLVCYQLRQGDANKPEEVFILKLTARSISPDLNIMNIVTKVLFDVVENICSVRYHHCLVMIIVIWQKDHWYTLAPEPDHDTVQCDTVFQWALETSSW